MPDDQQTSRAGGLRAGLHRLSARAVSLLLRPGAINDPANFELWERAGYHITPVHMYQPVPDTRELQADYPDSSGAAGIDLRPAYQLELLRELAHFADETRAFPAERPDAGGFYLNNGAFEGTDPHVYHCMIRRFTPRRIIEIGSGFSTLVGAGATRAGATRRDPAASYTVIDPWPWVFDGGSLADVTLLRQKAEETELALFATLGADDILFIDSSHVIRTGGDVAYLFLEVLPRLAKGVIVHVHDIYLPFEYPRRVILEEHRFFTEQYLLQAYLAENAAAEVLFANNYMAKTQRDALAAAFPGALWPGGASFWFRKRA